MVKRVLHLSLVASGFFCSVQFYTLNTFKHLSYQGQRYYLQSFGVPNISLSSLLDPVEVNTSTIATATATTTTKIATTSIDPKNQSNYDYIDFPSSVDVSNYQTLKTSQVHKNARTNVNATPTVISSNSSDDHNGDKRNDHNNHDDEYFSGCLLIMDDNHLLPEWLAYHYTFLPLRRLIVAIDPNSKTSPHQVLDRFRPYINITEWNDDDYGFVIDEEDTAIHNHRYRQKWFIQQCLRQLKEENGPTWVSFVDSDEYVVPNWNAKRKYRISTFDNNNNNMTVLEIMKNNQHLNYIAPNHPCFPKGRFRMTSKESSREQVFQNVPDGIDAMSLMTLRYRYSLGGIQQPDYSKSFIDVSRLNASDIVDHNHAVHRPVRSLCHEDTLTMYIRKSAFVVHHYAGTLENYLFRDDPRTAQRNETVYYTKFVNISKSYEDDSARFWISNFVNKVGGVQTANKLLANAGNTQLLK